MPTRKPSIHIAPHPTDTANIHSISHLSVLDLKGGEKKNILPLGDKLGNENDKPYQVHENRMDWMKTFVHKVCVFKILATLRLGRQLAVVQKNKVT